MKHPRQTLNARSTSTTVPTVRCDPPIKKVAGTPRAASRQAASARGHTPATWTHERPHHTRRFHGAGDPRRWHGMGAAFLCRRRAQRRRPRRGAAPARRSYMARRARRRGGHVRAERRDRPERRGGHVPRADRPDRGPDAGRGGRSLPPPGGPWLVYPP